MSVNQARQRHAKALVPALEDGRTRRPGLVFVEMDSPDVLQAGSESYAYGLDTTTSSSTQSGMNGPQAPRPGSRTISRSAVGGYRVPAPRI